MSSNLETYDFLVLGAGFFGVYAALYFSRKGLRVLLVEAEAEPWKKASIVNQARVHFGYHYPRSIATARLANDHRARFETDHASFINKEIEKYYGIDNHGSLTSAEQFQRFCNFVQIPCREVRRPDIFHQSRFEALFRTTEYSFDPFLLRGYYLAQIASSNVEMELMAWPSEAQPDGDAWNVVIESKTGTRRRVRATRVLNATYANINTVNTVFGVHEIDIFHEISEIAIIRGANLENIGLTVMDGPYLSVMPYGRSAFHSLSSVLYTHHAISFERHPTFGCQRARADCVSNAVRTCTTCSARPRSNLHKMLTQMNLYVKGGGEIYPHGSLFTVKAKLKSSFVDDARPTDVRIARTEPLFAYVFSGKINSIYEVEELLDDA